VIRVYFPPHGPAPLVALASMGTEVTPAEALPQPTLGVVTLCATDNSFILVEVIHSNIALEICAERAVTHYFNVPLESLEILLSVSDFKYLNSL